jgi:CHASE2 domain-containing sensor protein
MDDVSRPASPVLAEIIGAFVLFAVLVSIGRLARRGPSRMSTALLITAAAIAGFALVGVLLQG